ECACAADGAGGEPETGELGVVHAGTGSEGASTGRTFGTSTGSSSMCFNGSPTSPITGLPYFRIRPLRLVQQVVQLVQTVVDRFAGELEPLRQPPGFLRAEDRDDAHAAPPALDLNASRSARTSATSARVAAACATCTASSGDTSPGTLRKASTAAASWSIPLIS